MPATLLKNKPKPTPTLKRELVDEARAVSSLTETVLMDLDPSALLRMAFAREIVTPSKSAGSNLGWEQVALLLSNREAERTFRDMTEGTFKLVQIILTHATLDHVEPTSRSAEVRQFEEAYASIVSLVPDERRVQVLRHMREGLDKVTLTALATAPAATPTAKVGETAHVSTEDFMADLGPPWRRSWSASRRADASAYSLAQGRLHPKK